MARPRFHALLTAPLAWSAYRRWGACGAAGAVASGLFVDLDHLVDYAWMRRHGRPSHYFAPLHGWELALGLCLLGTWARRAAIARAMPADYLVQSPRLVRETLGRTWVADLASGLAAGLWLHLLQDYLTNRPRHPGVYALGYRAWHGFRREVTGWSEKTRFHQWGQRPWYHWF